MPVSEQQKKAQRKYDKKTKTISIKYTPVDIEDYNRLKTFIDSKPSVNININKFIKNLINEYFESGEDQRYNNKEKWLINKKIEVSLFNNIEWEKLELLDESYHLLLRKILYKTRQQIQKEIQDVINVNSERFSNWIDSINELIVTEEFIALAPEERRNFLNDFYKKNF